MALFGVGGECHAWALP